jgi:hypothetical protein
MSKFTLIPFDKITVPLRGWDRSKWNGWRLEGVELVYPAYVGGVYPIDLETCNRSSEVLDWIAQITGKEWATDECIAGLVRALDDILDLQANLCSRGDDKHLTVEQIRKRVRP